MPPPNKQLGEMTSRSYTMKPILAAVLSATLLALVSSPASSEPVLLYGPTVYANGAAGSLDIAHGSDNSVVPRIVADRFTLDTSVVVGGVVLWGGYISGDDNYPPDDF